jgi:hypothetical protein
VLPIKRTVFNIGDGEWKDTSVVADDVQIKFRIVTPVKKGEAPAVPGPPGT